MVLPLLILPPPTPFRYTVMNSIGQTVIAINTETCSFADRMLLRAHRRWRSVAAYFRHVKPSLVSVDNPARDAPGAKSAVFGGDGLPEARFGRASVVLIETEAQCSAAITNLRRNLGSTRCVGFDTEWIAYIPPHVGTNSNEAAIAQLCGSDDVCYIFLFYKWGGVCYDSFLSFMSDASITKAAVNIASDVSKFICRFPAAGRRGTPPLVAGQLNLEPGTLEQMTRRVFGEYVDKCIDHRAWEAPQLDDDQIVYAATDAWLHWRLAERRASGADDEEEVEGGEEEGGEEGGDKEGEEEGEDDGEEEGDQDGREGDEGERGEGGDRAACYRHERVPRVRVVFGSSMTDPNVWHAIDEVQDGAAEPEGDEDGEADVLDDEQQVAADQTLAFSRAKVMITDYFESERASDLELPSTFSRADRKKLHQFATSYALHSRSVGPEGDRRLIVSRWRPIEIVEASVGAKIVRALVAKEVEVPTRARRGSGNGEAAVQRRVVRGRVEAYDADLSRWTLSYDDDAVADEIIGLDELNVRLKRRFDYDHGRDGRGEPGAQPAKRGRADAEADGGLAGGSAPRVGALDDGYLQGLLDGVHTSWKSLKVKYDIRHFMANFGMMAAVEKNSPAFKIFMGYVSDAIYKMLHGEADRVRIHMRLLGMDEDAIRRTRRRYWRRMARYTCPDPATIIRGLYDVYAFFREMEDPARPGHGFFVDSAEKIFLKEIAYVQKGYLSDVPNLNYYFIRHVCQRTQFIFFRNIRSSSALEGYHTHLRAAQHPCAKGAGPRIEMARTLLFDFAWNVRAAVHANHQPDAGHFHLWLIDALHDLLDEWLEKDKWPTAMRSWLRTDTRVAPTTFRGIDFAALDALVAQGIKAVELSPLTSREERLKVLKHPTLLARGDAAGIARATGITTSDRILKALAAELVVEARTRQLLEAHGVLNLAQRTRRTAEAPRAVRPPPATLAPVEEEEEERDAQGARGPLPIAADVVRLHGADAADVVATEGPLPVEVAADPQVVLLPVPKKGEQDDEGRTRAQVLALNRVRRWTAKQTPEARAARNGKRKERGDQRQDARARRRSGDSEDEGEEECEEEDE